MSGHLRRLEQIRHGPHQAITNDIKQWDIAITNDNYEKNKWEYFYQKMQFYNQTLLTFNPTIWGDNGAAPPPPVGTLLSLLINF